MSLDLLTGTAWLWVVVVVGVPGLCIPWQLPSGRDGDATRNAYWEVLVHTGLVYALCGESLPPVLVPWK